MRTVTIVRNRGWYGMFRDAILLADDLEIGRVAIGETITVNLPDNTDNLTVKMDWGRSLPYPTADVRDGQTIYMNGWFTLNLIRSAGLSSIPIALQDQPT